MKNRTLVASLMAATIGLAACGSADKATTAEAGDAETPAPAGDTVIVNNDPAGTTESDRARISIDPDGASVEVRDGGVDVDVDTEGRGSLDVEM